MKERNGPHLILLQHHEIKMLDPLRSIIAHTLLERWRVDDVPHVFIDERVSATTMRKSWGQFNSHSLA
jgi:hypothetical protein